MKRERPAREVRPRNGTRAARPARPRPDERRDESVRSAHRHEAAQQTGSGGAARVTSLVVDALAYALAQVFRFEAPADAVMSRFFRDNASLGRRDRSLVAEAIFFALRRYATLGWAMQPASPVRAPRLAALVTLARQHGLDALDPRALRGDAAAVKNALAVDLGRAPASVRAELPHWLYLAVTEQYEDAAALLDALTLPAPLDLRVNLIRASRDAVVEELAQHHVRAERTPYSPEGLRLAEKPALTQWPAYREGRIEVQDEGSQLIARLVQPRRGEMIVDFCAGAGGKTLALGALMRSSGRLYAFDINQRRLEGLGPRLKRSGLSNVHPVAIRNETDARVKRLHGKCDRVLVDAPCSGSGTLRRNPDLKWRFDESEMMRVNGVQHAVLAAAARLLKPGGRLVYATCSLLELENQRVIEALLAAAPEYRLVPAADILAAQSIIIDHAARFAPYFVMLPHLHGTDGFFAAVIERN
jgi:16S rRNA (cytosine967-C5)-methyltransferase